MPRHVEFETTIKGGLPVIIKASVYPPEPDVGYMGPHAEFEIYWPNGGLCGINITDDDWQRIYNECLEE